jgi:ribosome assembly protein 1
MANDQRDIATLIEGRVMAGTYTDENSLRGKEQLIATARAEGKSADEALASTDDAVLQEQLSTLQDQGDAQEARAGLRLLKDFENSIEAGFQMATFQGPLCAEPVVGMGWIVEEVKMNKEEEGDQEGRSMLSCVAQAVARELLADTL